jgi:Lrp/AsnC family transcriptional regulator
MGSPRLRPRRSTEGLPTITSSFAMEQLKYTTALPLPR